MRVWQAGMGGQAKLRATEMFLDQLLKLVTYWIVLIIPDAVKIRMTRLDELFILPSASSHAAKRDGGCGAGL